jgi:hypothetical protein
MLALWSKESKESGTLRTAIHLEWWNSAKKCPCPYDKGISILRILRFTVNIPVFTGNHPSQTENLSSASQDHATFASSTFKTNNMKALSTIIIAAVLTLNMNFVFAGNESPATPAVMENSVISLKSVAPVTPLDATFDEVSPEVNVLNLAPYTPGEACFEELTEETTIDLSLIAPVTPEEADFEWEVFPFLIGFRSCQYLAASFYYMLKPGLGLIFWWCQESDLDEALLFFLISYRSLVSDSLLRSDIKITVFPPSRITGYKSEVFPVRCFELADLSLCFVCFRLFSNVSFFIV